MPSPISITSEGEEAIAAATVETIVQARGAATSKRRIVEWNCGLDATDAGTALVDLLRQTTDGTATGGTEVLWDPDDPAADWTGFHSFSAEPTPGDILASYQVPQNGGDVGWQYPFGTEPILDSATTSRIGVRVLAPSACNAVAHLVLI